jgi:hypothetical protein
VTVVIPVRIDSPDRSRNLELVLSWLESRFTGHKTLIVEHDVETKTATPASTEASTRISDAPGELAAAADTLANRTS